MAKLGYVSKIGEIWHKKTELNQGEKMRLKIIYNFFKKFKIKKKKTDLHLHFFIARMRKFAPLKITTIIIIIN
jgi:hypothetical protein